MPFAMYAAVIALVGVERLVELVVSRRNAARVLARGGVEHGASHFPLMAAMHSAFLVCALFESWFRARPIALVAPMLLVAVLAQALRWWAITTLGERWNVRIFVLPGAAPVIGGPYRFLAHPNYVAVALEIAALPLAGGAWLTAIVFSILNAWMLRVRIRAEETALGDAWAHAFRRASP